MERLAKLQTVSVSILTQTRATGRLWNVLGTVPSCRWPFVLAISTIVSRQFRLSFRLNLTDRVSAKSRACLISTAFSMLSPMVVTGRTWTSRLSWGFPIVCRTVRLKT